MTGCRRRPPLIQGRPRVQSCSPLKVCVLRVRYGKELAVADKRNVQVSTEVQICLFTWTRRC
jgi:hypothetical protein